MKSRLYLPLSLPYFLPLQNRTQGFGLFLLRAPFRFPLTLLIALPPPPVSIPLPFQNYLVSFSPFQSLTFPLESRLAKSPHPRQTSDPQSAMYSLPRYGLLYFSCSESNDHFFIHCPFTLLLRVKLHRLIGVDWIAPSTTSQLISNWKYVPITSS